MLNKVREKYVRERFARHMAGDLPEFKASYFGNVSKNLVCYRHDSLLINYVTLKIEQNFNQFTILVTWMLSDLPPVHATPGSPDGDPNQDGLTIDLTLLWNRSIRPWKVKYLPPKEDLEAWAGRNPEIDLADEDRTKAYFYADDAFDKLIQLGIPYLNSRNEAYASRGSGRDEMID